MKNKKAIHINLSVQAVFIHGKSLLLGKRQPHLKTYPGFWSFPGGKIDKEELKIADERESHLMALIREIKEELGVEPSNYLNKNRKNLIYLGFALTPSIGKVRFKTFYYAILISEPFKIDEDALCEEFEAIQWMEADDFFRSYDQSDILCVPPLRHIFKKLDFFFQTNKNIHAFDEVDFNPLDYVEKEQKLVQVEMQKGIEIIFVPSHTLPPAKMTNAFIIGDNKKYRLLVDPAPKDEESYARLKNNLKKISLFGIFITHHHKDHVERLPRLAKELKKVVYLSRETLQNINMAYGYDFLSGVAFRTVDSQEVMGGLYGKKIRVERLPGHDNGQLGLSYGDKWMVISDILQGVGPVVIGAPEGDMKVYMETLDKLINRNPQVLYPSHGLPMAGLHWLHRVKKHRLCREKNILNCVQNGHTADEIYNLLYSDVPPALKPYAMKNIFSHIRKLKQEGKIK